MLKGLVWGSFCLSAMAAANSTSTRPPVELNVTSGLDPVCFYEDRRYSRGSVIEMGKQLFVCEREQSFEQNGRLSWHPFPLESNDKR
ncbi:DUF1496 domain-containing protein [Oceanisphaera arctica]|uniref:DUF1496 domain-containing protein n=1 Tax=Oceanisphaera arctica TaxID=641510 RepID=A0A2P5TJ73_9GAMM|nr:DUF1496 domain-containing protein [Oceanisphaera arctica]PPL14969.1 hypothetical protein UN63_14185 [Oceanisphaera arctica]GHA30111.1 hypothetical protein GCM10007082_32550 [Oceanisphaera arctica]